MKIIAVIGRGFGGALPFFMHYHRGAIEMSQNALRYPICPELVPILDAIISSQQEGIRKMERLLCCM